MLRRLARLWPFALVTFLYLATSPYHQGLNNPNEMVRVYMTKALADEHSPVIDGVIARFGGVDDKAVRDGHLYSSKAPLQSYAGLLPYRLFWRGAHQDERRELTQLLRRTASVPVGLALAFALLVIARKRALALGAPERAGTAIGLSLALGSMLFPYAITFTGHIWAAATAGGAFVLAALAADDPALPARRRRLYTVLVGALAGLSPFAEYPSTLVAFPALLMVLVGRSGLRARITAALELGLGGALPFLFGLWMHQESWGSPFKTGYAFLENKAYQEVHKGGFFGVGAPKLEAFLGALFSPGTGLFFFSPILFVGLLALLVGLFRGSERVRALPRAAAWFGLLGAGLSFLFIAGHTGWRGGWTVGPRYIIAVTPLFGIFVVEALAYRRLRWLLGPLAVTSVVVTGAAAALYPHLSDVYTNPIVTFLWPTYQQGYTSYGLGQALGLAGKRANLVHLIPLGIAALYVGAAFGQRDGFGARLRALVFSLSMALLLLIGATRVKELDPAAAERENQRLWGFWEPARAKDPSPAEDHPLFTARGRIAGIEVHSVDKDGVERGCTPEGNGRCRYGPSDWHHLAAEELDFDGKRLPIAFMHPIGGGVVRATIPLVPSARRAIFDYGLADASVASGNASPVSLSLLQRDQVLAKVEAGRQRGLLHLPLSLTSTAPITLELRVDNEGARVFGFDLRVYGD
ncbi:MAG: hypothetical protein U1E65_06375 [Myxococcota bacterium]